MFYSAPVAVVIQPAPCAQLPACAEKLGDPQAQFRALAEELRTAPRTVHYRDAATGEDLFNGEYLIYNNTFHDE